MGEEIKEAKYFSLLSEETADISKTQQVSICFQYIDADCEIHEDFVGFVGTRNATERDLGRNSSPEGSGLWS